jgi:hypothetical protein
LYEVSLAELERLYIHVRINQARTVAIEQVL